MPRGVYIYLTDEEKDALCKLAEVNRRHPQAQGALIVRRELERLGLLPVPPERDEDESE